MKVKCEYCDSLIEDTDAICPHCGAPNEHMAASAEGVPKTIEELKPVRWPEEPEPGDEEQNEAPQAVGDAFENLDPDAGKSRQQIIDEMTGQLRLFPDED